jgi:hypothetical protein
MTNPMKPLLTIYKVGKNSQIQDGRQNGLIFRQK